MTMSSLTDAERDSLTECECGHFANEHSSDGCLASSYDRDDGLASDDAVCVCSHSPSAINRHAIETIITDRTATAVQAERDRLLARIEALPAHNDTPSNADNLEYAAKHPTLCRSWIFDVLIGLAHLLAEERAR